MRKKVLVLCWVLVMLVWYWFYLPPLTIFSLSFWLFLFVGTWFGIALTYLYQLFQSEWWRRKAGSQSGVKRTVRFASPPTPKVSAVVKWAFLGSVLIFGGISLLNFSQSRVFRAKSYARVITVKNASFEKNFPKTDLSHLALLDRQSAEKIGDTYLGTIDKVSQFGISDAYRQITIGNQPFRVSPLEYKNFWKWLSNRKEGIDYYVKVNQTTGKADLVRLDKAMRYSDSEYLWRDTKRHLRLQYPTTIFEDPSFEVDDKGHPYYVPA